MRWMRAISMTGFGMLVVLALTGAGGDKSGGVVGAKDMADALHAVMEADRTVYAKEVVNRLQDQEKVIRATEHWKDDKALPLPNGPQCS
jgi:hypothetical protein